MIKHVNTVVAWLCLGWAVMALAQTAPVADKSAPTAASSPLTQDQGEEILNELRLIRKALEDRNTVTESARPISRPAQDVKMMVDRGWFAIGSEQAPVTLIEFSDFQCSFCRQFNRDTFLQIKKKFIDTGKVRFVSREFPLQFHPDAARAALAVRCAGAQQHYWEMRDSLIENSSNLGREVLDREAVRLHLNMNDFHACMETRRFLHDIQRDTADGQAIGVTGTPAFLIGRTDPNVIEGVRIDGAQSYDRFATEIDSALGRH